MYGFTCIRSCRRIVERVRNVFGQKPQWNLPLMNLKVSSGVGDSGFAGGERDAGFSSTMGTTGRSNVGGC